MARARSRMALSLGVLCVGLCVGPGATAWSRAVATTWSATEAASGELEGTRSLPPRGAGYRTYSVIGSAIGRQHADHRVIAALRQALASAGDEAGRTYTVAEVGWPSGGAFPPHRTHREGLSVDILMPMLDASGSPASLPSWPWTGWGYCWHLDGEGALRSMAWEAPLPVVRGHEVDPCPFPGRGGGWTADFDGLRLLLEAVLEAAPAHGVRLTRVIVAPEYADRIGAGSAVDPLLTRRGVWVRHDDHVHLDFRSLP